MVRTHVICRTETSTSHYLILPVLNYCTSTSLVFFNKIWRVHCWVESHAFVIPFSPTYPVHMITAEGLCPVKSYKRASLNHLKIKNDYVSFSLSPTLSKGLILFCQHGNWKNALPMLLVHYDRKQKDHPVMCCFTLWSQKSYLICNEGWF